MIPISLSVENTTEGFDYDAGVHLHAGASQLVKVLHFSSSGVSCQELGGQYTASSSNVLGLSSVQPLSPGDRIAVDGYLVVVDAFTPAAPQGEAHGDRPATAGIITYADNPKVPNSPPYATGRQVCATGPR